MTDKAWSSNSTARLFFFSSRQGDVSAKLVAVFTMLFVGTLAYSSLCFGDHSAKSVSVEAVLQKLREREDLVLIDVRGRTEFDKFRIPGSVNIPLFALKTKTFLKSKPVVLVNEGHQYKQLMDECALLSHAGFTVSILDGGLYQWRRKGGSLEGDVFAQRELNEISLQTYFAGRNSENWMVVYVSVSRKTEPHVKDVPWAHIPLADDPKEFISKLKTARKNYSKKEFASILICDENGRTYEEIERQAQAAKIENVLYLKGGFEAYKTFEQQQMSMARAKSAGGAEKSTKAKKNCGACP
jgi:rhodanese-related sulfurtransferase